MHIISASRRTDVPAFYSRWFINRIRAGKVGVKAPFGGKNYEVSLRLDDVIAIVLWTKNLRPLLKYFDELVDAGYRFVVHHTLNGYPSHIEPHVPPLAYGVKTLKMIKKRFRIPIVWRYDTIVLTSEISPDWHIENFRRISESLSGLVDECVFSFCDYYRKTANNMKSRNLDYIIPDIGHSRELSETLASIADKSSIAMNSCSHDTLLSEKIGKARCVDPVRISAVVNDPLKMLQIAKLRVQPTRKGCGCIASRDIGAYDTCLHGCVYCYANSNYQNAVNKSGMISNDGYSLDPPIKVLNI